jgi:hypothetical protein
MYEKSKIVKNHLKQVKWDEISDNWEIQVYIGTRYQTISLNPYQDCSKSNPLYMHEKWLKWVYTNIELNLTDQEIAKICDCGNKTIGNWRKTFNIPTKIAGHYFKKGYKFLLMSKEYKHPEVNPMGDKKVYRAEQIIIMEDHINKTLTSRELSLHPCLVKNESKYYIKTECHVHHKNHIRLDNRIENLWLYKDTSEHSNTNINICFSNLFKLEQILFSKGNYFINHNYDYRCLNTDEIDKIIRQKKFVDYRDVELVKKTIKKMDWTDIDWNIVYHIRNNAPEEEKELNPHRDCSKRNPLYRHKGWVELIVHDKRFYLTDQRLGILCGISTSSARYWRQRYHKIVKNPWGYDKLLMKSSGGKRVIYQKVAKSYGNPFATEKINHTLMRESRYIVENNLAQEPELNEKYLINGKYLKPEYLVHHINLDMLDNRLENFYLCEGASEHNKVHNSLIKLVDELLSLGLMNFDSGKYFLVCP